MSALVCPRCEGPLTGARLKRGFPSDAFAEPCGCLLGERPIWHHRGPQLEAKYPTVTCHECGKVQTATYDAETIVRLVNGRRCFGCNFWNEKLSENGHPHVVIADGVWYGIGSQTESTPKEFRGFGGTRYLVTFHDGRKVETVDLWYAGKIPAHYRERMPDNATLEAVRRRGAA